MKEFDVGFEFMNLLEENTTKDKNIQDLGKYANNL